MLTLLIDTSTDKSLIAFAQGDTLLSKFFLPHGVQSSRTLMTEIENGFKQLNQLPSALEAIAISIGPGSYTGIRVGAAAAKGLSFAKNLPLISFCSLEGFVPERDGKFASLIDARIGGFYVLLQEKEGNSVRKLNEPQLIAKENLDSVLKEFPLQAGPHLGYPDPAHLARLAAHKYQKGEFSSDLELLYLRTPEYRST